MPYVLFQSCIRIGLWRIIIMTTMVVSITLHCVHVCICVFSLLSLILCGSSGLSKTPGPLNTSYNQRSLSLSWSFFIVLSTAPKMSNSVSQYGCGKVNDRLGMLLALPRNSECLLPSGHGVFLFFCCHVIVWQKCE